MLLELYDVVFGFWTERSGFIEDARLVDERVGDKPVYLILAMGADKVVRLKPQNLVAGLPLAAAANVT